MIADAVDRILEVPVAPSFTRVGFAARRSLEHWTSLDDYDLNGRTIAITGATSGLGLAAARQLGSCGARLVLLGRNQAKTQRVCADVAAATGAEAIPVVADMGDLPAVRSASAQIAELAPALDVLVHNAGALSAERRQNDAGVEQTVASQVVGPHAMTTALLPVLRAAAPGRVLTMSSGGMYSAPLSVSGLQMSEDTYKGAEQYARAKRAQVTINEMWADRVPVAEVVFHALHPGWADTPGVEESLPTFRRIVGPLLRSPAEGADTLVWLAADDGEPLATSGGFWLDRRRRNIHKLPTTRRTDTAERRLALWDWVEAAAGA